MKAILIEKYADNGELSHYQIVNEETGEVIVCQEIYEDMLSALINDCREDYLKQVDNPMIGKNAKYTKHKYIIQRATMKAIEEVMSNRD